MLDHQGQSIDPIGVVPDEDYPVTSAVERRGQVLVGEALDLIAAMLVELIEHSAVDADEYADDLDRVSHIASRLREH